MIEFYELIVTPFNHLYLSNLYLIAVAQGNWLALLPIRLLLLNGILLGVALLEVSAVPEIGAFTRKKICIGSTTFFRSCFRFRNAADRNFETHEFKLRPRISRTDQNLGIRQGLSTEIDTINYLFH